MKLVVIGGNARKAGKTLVVSGIIRGLRSLEWTAVKITPHFHGLEPVTESGTTSQAGRGFLLTEEKSPLARGDTGRYLAAGAKRALLLRVQPGSLPEALPALRKALAASQFVMIESNSILYYLRPTVCVFVFASAPRRVKSSARRLVRQADALVGVGPRSDPPRWRDLIPGFIRTRPAFLISSGERTNPKLCRLIRRRLARAEDDAWPRIPAAHDEIKEQMWLH